MSFLVVGAAFRRQSAVGRGGENSLPRFPFRCSDWLVDIEGLAAVA